MGPTHQPNGSRHLPHLPCVRSCLGEETSPLFNTSCLSTLQPAGSPTQRTLMEDDARMGIPSSWPPPLTTGEASCPPYLAAERGESLPNHCLYNNALLRRVHKIFLNSIVFLLTYSMVLMCSAFKLMGGSPTSNDSQYFIFFCLL